MAKENQVISIFYELRDLQTKEILDSNLDKEKLSFILGKGQIIPGLENELYNLNQGDRANVEVKAQDAYGEYNENAVEKLPKEQFAGIELTKGMTLFGESNDGRSVQVFVKDFDDNEVTIDYNHPLASKDLLFDVRIEEVRDATDDELAAGVVGGISGGCCGGAHHDEHGGGCCGGSHHDSGGGCCSSQHEEKETKIS